MLGPARRAVLFGRFNVAWDFPPGIFFIFIIPVGTLVCLRVLAFSPLVLELVPYTAMLLLTCIIIVLAVLSEWTMISLFLCDPGFTDDAEGGEVYCCPVCQHYVRGYDHHCGILGVCVGERNIGFFISFLTCVSCLMWLFAGYASVMALASLKEVFAHRLLRERLLLLLTKEWWFASKMRPVTFILLFLLCYGASFTTLLGAVYWFQLWRGMHSLQRRRNTALRMTKNDVFRHMWTPTLAGTALLNRVNAEKRVHVQLAEEAV
ncbi:hypothetical protein TraAM80_07542 [Trypanosoma rangeli]|uniref:Palmitoyltransferase n=1 Tax=Trypanosoma rangeli TaxID=5698 RepID=A0A3R7M6T4_TRYRA|nr:uncharacterized protein TraAM80_07542 [Trypanosoma rangeli]RNF00510.1 hypothetical protein TraAM80_07542 [Trypanosoma rangeli]|eukprot:RNF00510.1 hypothetical protein TraAM80_07542 [Trypanosoma rangeli]